VIKKILVTLKGLKVKADKLMQDLENLRQDLKDEVDASKQQNSDLKMEIDDLTRERETSFAGLCLSELWPPPPSLLSPNSFLECLEKRNSATHAHMMTSKPWF